MTYDEALEIAKQGKPVKRRLWRTFVLNTRPSRIMKGKERVEHPTKRDLVITTLDDVRGERYRPTTFDKKAMDWENA